ncbi:MAG: hypothetical protein EBS50_09595 [Sphingomonadaceae bacterium]|nr:hypothetical protein [Sphingomonadaceae bacterium]
MRIPFFCVAMMTGAIAFAAPQQNPAPIAANEPSYADLADFALASKITAHVRIRGARALTGEFAAGTKPGFQRLLITADLVALIKAPEGQSPQIRYIQDLPIDSRGKPPKLRKSESLIFAQPARPGEVQLSAPNASVSWTAEREQTVRTILAEAANPNSPPRVRGIASAFHSIGSLPGEGETQIFLDTADNRPASLTVQRRAGEAPIWFVSLGEVVDEGVSKPAANTLLWYRLACFLPAQMPAGVTQGQTESDSQQVAADYQMIISALGPCTRTLPKP